MDLRVWGVCLAVVMAGMLLGCGGSSGGKSGGGQPGPTTNGAAMTVLGYNDLGMHCMNQDFSEMMILPPYNTLHAQVIDRRGDGPRLVTSGISVGYTIPGNTHSADKTNFWSFAKPLLGVSPAQNIGLTGNGLSGMMTANPSGDWSATGIPLTPITDAGQENAYQLATVTVTANGKTMAQTQAVTPVSWEISCNLCHNTAGISTATDILRAHDRLHGTTLEAQKPVLCGQCHQQAPLGTTGQAGVPPLSTSMHSAHASRMAPVLGQVNNVACYACHPGIRTHCLRDVHFSGGMTCTDCHTSIEAVGSAGRRPWVDEPRCADCHGKTNPSLQYEQPNTLYRDSRGHHGVHCSACHGSPHAITPTVVAADNVQAVTVQGHAGTINKCTVCHSQQPGDSFDHRFSGGGN